MYIYKITSHGILAEHWGLAPYVSSSPYDITDWLKKSVYPTACKMQVYHYLKIWHMNVPDWYDENSLTMMELCNTLDNSVLGSIRLEMIKLP